MQRRGDRDKVLSYYDVLLRRGDVRLLEGPEWLNDQVFWRLVDGVQRILVTHSAVRMSKCSNLGVQILLT